MRPWPAEGDNEALEEKVRRRNFKDHILATIIAILLVSSFGCSGESCKIPITTSSEEARQLFLKGQDLSERLRHPAAYEYFVQAIEKDPDFALAHLYLAGLQPTSIGFFEELDKAVALLDRVSEGERLMILGMQAEVNAQPAKQQEYYVQLVAAYPNDELAHSLLGSSYFYQQEYEKAIEQFKKTVDIERECSSAYNLLGYSYRHLGDYVRAEKAFKEYIELIPNDPNPYDSYAELLLKMGKYGESIESYYKALELDPGFYPSHIGIATNLNYLGKHRHARDELQEMYESATSDAQRREALYARAVSYVDEGFLNKALGELEKRYELSAETGDVRYMSQTLAIMGTVYLENKQYDKALEKYEAGLKLILDSDLSPEIKESAKNEALFHTARVALMKKEFEVAKVKAEEYHIGATDHVNRIRMWHQLLGLIALEEQNYEKALEELMLSNLQNAHNIYRVALAYQGLGDNVKAKEWFTKAADFNDLNNMSYAFIRLKAKKMVAALQDIQT